MSALEKGSVLFRIVQRWKSKLERERDRRRRSNAKRYQGALLKFVSVPSGPKRHDSFSVRESREKEIVRGVYGNRGKVLFALNDGDRASYRDWNDFLQPSPSSLSFSSFRSVHLILVAFV